MHAKKNIFRRIQPILITAILFVTCCSQLAFAQSPCLFNGDCPVPFVCAGNRCRVECSSDRDCRTDEICARNAAPGGFQTSPALAAPVCVSREAYSVQIAPPVEEAPRYGLNMAGSDYAVLIMKQNDWQLCYRACKNDSWCRAWTFVNTGVQGPVPYCWLKTQSSEGSSDPNAVSGSIRR